MPDALELAPIAHARGTVALPGSKSITNRALLLAALAQGTTRLTGVLDADDTMRMVEALRTLGVRLDPGPGAGTWTVTGAAGRFPVDRAALMLGNAGTAVRPLTAVLAMRGGDYSIDGVARMRERPIGDLVDALRAAGCTLRYLGAEGFPPLAVGAPGGRAGGTIAIRGDVSSQFVSALLISLPLAAGADLRATTVVLAGALVSRPYVEITTRLMARFGVDVRHDGGSAWTIDAGAKYLSPRAFAVEGDASAASYFLAAGALGGGPVRVTGVGSDSVQGDVAFARVLAAQGATVSMGRDWIEASAGARFAGGAIDCLAIPDAAMTLAVTALYAAAPTRLTGIGSWRVKETDRIAAVAAELAKLGADVTTGPDWIEIVPPPALAPATIDTWDDHRMAMSFALAAFGGARVTINDPGCVSKTYPDFFRAFASVTAARVDEPGLSVTADPAGAAPVIAIDGPAASGKGTIAWQVAQALGFHYLDSGALYRLVALAAIEHAIDPGDAARLAREAAGLAARFEGTNIAAAGRDVTELLRSEAVSAMASRVAVHREVREALLARQRAFRQPPGLVAEGRDMGTVVFPDAGLKLFLTASVEARADRRYKQLIEKGISVTLADLLRDIRERDRRDSTRAAAPLAAAADAVILDTTGMSIDAVTAAVLALHARGARAADAGMPRKG
ncbi:MAG: 3-phosphoshikimate 1-carboxyvinyltransferase [Proteobacteria bacterium]|nr:3-phosphoshikimate 1-carboxyvinyltransferase [Pseudomonadota bacterium]